MRFKETAIDGAFIVELTPHSDERGYFARTYCEEEFGKQGLNTRWPQNNVSFNKERGTLRGMHYQSAPHEEVKLVRCFQGGIHDVIIDMRPGSPSYLRHVGVDLTKENGRALYIPGGCAHGFITLENETLVHYHMGNVYVPEAARGVRWDDPRFGIVWPEPVRVIAERDAGYPDFTG